MWIPDSDLKDDSMEMKVSVDYLKMLKASRKERLKKKKPDLHAQLWEDLMRTLECGKIGKEIKKKLFKIFRGSWC